MKVLNGSDTRISSQEGWCDFSNTIAWRFLEYCQRRIQGSIDRASNVDFTTPYMCSIM